MKAFTITKSWIFILSALILINIASCTKPATVNEPDYGCDSKVTLQTLTNTPGQLVFNPTQGEWQVMIDLPGSISFGCNFCDQSAIAAVVAGKSTSFVINVTVTGNVKRRYSNQIPLSITTGYKEIYVISLAAVN